MMLGYPKRNSSGFIAFFPSNWTMLTSICEFPVRMFNVPLGPFVTVPVGNWRSESAVGRFADNIFKIFPFQYVNEPGQGVYARICASMSWLVLSQFINQSSFLCFDVKVASASFWAIVSTKLSLSALAMQSCSKSAPISNSDLVNELVVSEKLM